MNGKMIVQKVPIHDGQGTFLNCVSISSKCLTFAINCPKMKVVNVRAG
ncbi:hypothetical protein J32TS2_38190 [Shouchella clausii]|nr:hypothetical protein J32TS2_38190 [Shouchella clausii]